jgi:hypothetical protein
MEPAIQREALFVLAEIAIALAGFAGIVAAIGKPETDLDRWHGRQVVEVGVWLVALSLLPVLVDLLGVSAAAVWRSSSGVVLLVVGGYYLVNRGSVKTLIHAPSVSFVAVGDFLALATCAANTAGLTGAYYEAGYMYVLYWFLVQGLVYFFLSAKVLWTRPR